jgi:hypothetical protein
MFRIQRDKISLFKIKNKFFKSESNLSNNKLSFHKLNVNFNIKINKYNFPIDWNADSYYLFSVNNNKSEKIYSLNISPQKNSNIFIDDERFSKKKLKSIIIKKNKNEKNLISLTRNQTVINFKKKINHKSAEKIKKNISSIIPYHNFNKTSSYFQTLKSTNFISISNINSDKRNILKKRQYCLSNNLSQSINKKFKKKIINKFKFQNNFINRKQLFSSITNKKCSSFFLSSSSEDQIISYKILNNGAEKKENKENKKIDLSNVKFTNNLIRKFINKNQFKSNLHINQKSLTNK